jgi:hypothetical protein
MKVINLKSNETVIQSFAVPFVKEEEKDSLHRIWVALRDFFAFVHQPVAHVAKVYF